MSDDTWKDACAPLDWAVQWCKINGIELVEGEDGDLKFMRDGIHIDTMTASARGAQSYNWWLAYPEWARECIAVEGTVLLGGVE